MPREVFLGALDELARAGVPVVDDRDRAWQAFAHERRRYERLLFTIAGLVDAAPTDWLPAELFDTHRPPVLRLHRASRAARGE